jgi:hypothetical protein
MAGPPKDERDTVRGLAGSLPGGSFPGGRAEWVRPRDPISNKNRNKNRIKNRKTKNRKRRKR